MKFEEVMNIGIPALLIIIVLGFLWIKFLEPWVFPMLSKLWLWISGAAKTEDVPIRKEISYG